MNVETGFFLLCLIVFVGVRAILRQGMSPMTGRLTSLVFSLWLVVTALLAHSGFLAEAPESIPPRFAVVVVPMLAFLIWLAVSKKAMTATARVSISAVAGLQFFRVGVEIVIHQLVQAGLMPEVMTWNGRNFDIVTGIAAPAVAWVLAKDPVKNRKVALAWNWLGTLLLLNAVVHGMLTAPSPFRIESLGRPNVAVLHSPYVWIVSLCVFVAASSHVWMIRRLSSKLSP